MSEYKTYEGPLLVKGSRFCIVSSRFNSFIVESLTGGATDALLRHGASAKNINLGYQSLLVS